jgi:hypothetical protein
MLFGSFLSVSLYKFQSMKITTKETLPQNLIDAGITRNTEYDVKYYMIVIMQKNYKKYTTN